MTRKYNVFRSDRTLDEFNTIRTDRPNLPSNSNITGGGCLNAIKNNISTLRMNKWESEVPFDNVWLKLNTSGHSKIYLHTVYLPGSADAEITRQYYDQLFDIINHREPYARFIIIGDFNLPTILWSESGNHFAPNLAQYNGIKENNRNILDLVLANTAISVSSTPELVIIDEFHPPILLEFDRKDIKFLKAIKSPKLNFFRANYDEINTKLSLVNWQNELKKVNIDEDLDIFYNIVNKIIREHTPLIKPKSDDYPKWYSHDLIEMIKDKEYYRKKYNETSNELYNNLFIAKRREVKNKQRECLYKYHNSIESMISNNPKSFFAYTKAQRQNNKLPAAMFFKEKVSESLDETANLFGEYFSSVYAQQDTDFQIVNLINSSDYFDLSRDDIKSIITKMDEFKCNSPDDIPIVFYKRNVDHIIEPLYLLFKLATTTMTYPKIWKTSFVSPIFKSGDNTNIENYSPISILPAISKIFDKLIYRHIHSAVAHLLVHAQHGFTAGKSTLSNLFEFITYNSSVISVIAFSHVCVWSK